VKSVIVMEPTAKMVKVNEGPIDRAVRIAIGIAGLALGYFISPWFYILAVAGIFTGVTGYCGLYTLLKIDTLPKQKKKK
jgi:hypothetical protein